ncbi:MAG TPA: diguanylate cyclase [Candidatus Dormibacteraeota bacterium]|nr:diguanylate cyclase [Candidatus Dormibacteraeota bacterium]
MTRVWTGLNFSVKFGAILALAAVLIAIIPLSLASRENRLQATQRATDKAGIVANLIAGQQTSLSAFAAGMAQELAPALTTANTSALQTTLQRYSDVNTASDVVGASGPLADAAVRGGSPLPSGSPLMHALVPALGSSPPLIAGPDGTPWLMASANVRGTGETVFIARPLDAVFLRGLEGTITTQADPAGIAVVRGSTVVSAGSMVLDQTLVPGTSLSASGISAVLPQDAAAQVVRVGGRDAAAAAHSLGSGFAVVVSTPVSEVSTFWQPIAILLGLIVVAIVFIVLVVQTDLQRPLRRLDRAVAALARDEYDIPVPRIANDEIGRLASSFEEMRRQSRALITATRARAVIATELNLPQPLQTALGAVCAQLRGAAVGADSAFILVDRSEMTEDFAVVDGDDLDVDVSAALSGDGPLGSGHRHEGPDALLAGAVAGSREARTGMHDFCVAPLRMGPNVLGVLGLARVSGGFTSADAALVASSAEQVALALERYRFIAMVQRQASIDDLTGLYNHRFLIDYLGQQVALAERLNTSLAILVLDIDHFKAVNDTHGHPAGDAVLSAFAQTLTGSIRRADLAARYGGEEFIVVMSNTSAADARRVAEKIRAAAEAMAVPIDGGRSSASLTVSVGGAAYPEDTITAAELLATADAALYDAKNGGRNRVCMAGERIVAMEVPSNVTSVVRSRRSAQ